MLKALTAETSAETRHAADMSELGIKEIASSLQDIAVNNVVCMSIN